MISRDRIKVIFDCNALDRIVQFMGVNDDIKNKFIEYYSYCQTPHLTCEMVGIVCSANIRHRLMERCKYLLDITRDENRCLRPCVDIALGQLNGQTVVYETEEYFKKWEHALSSCSNGDYRQFQILANDVKSKKEKQRRYFEKHKHGDPLDRLIYNILGIDRASQINTIMKEPSANWLRSYMSIFYDYHSGSSLNANDWWDLQQLVYLEEVDLIVSDDRKMLSKLNRLSSIDSCNDDEPNKIVVRVEKFINYIMHL